jgi:hypothetical protein
VGSGGVMLSHVGWYVWRNQQVLVRMIGFMSTSVTVSLNYSQYSAIADLHTFQCTVVHALGFSVFISCLLATDLNTETIASNHYEVFLPFLIQSLWNLGTQLKTYLDSVLSTNLHNSLRTCYILVPILSNAPSFWIRLFYKHSAQTPRKTQAVFLMTSPRYIAPSDTRKFVYGAVD